MKTPRRWALALAVCWWGAAAAQAPADFSGRWTLDVPAPQASAGGQQPAARGDMGSGWGSPLTITQSATELIVEFTSYTRYDLQPPTKFVYALNGSETRNVLMAGRGMQALPSKASWDGDRLTIVTTFTNAESPAAAPPTTELKQVLSIEAPGTLVIDTTRSPVHGGKPTTTRSRYRRD
jgi:hypothetical protein